MNKPHFNNYPTNICLFKVNNRNSRKRCEICSKLTMKTPERHWRHWRCSGVFIVNFEHISHLFLLLLLLTLIEQENVKSDWFSSYSWLDLSLSVNYDLIRKIPKYNYNLMFNYQLLKTSDDTSLESNKTYFEK